MILFSVVFLRPVFLFFVYYFWAPASTYMTSKFIMIRRVARGGYPSSFHAQGSSFVHPWTLTYTVS